MPPTLIATAKDPSANSYTTVAEADTFLDSQLYTGTWAAANANDKARALIMATRYLDQLMDWKGAIRTITQALRFPRSGLVTADGINITYDDVPDFMKQATAHMALALLTKDRAAEPGLWGKGFSEAQLGPMKIKVSDQELLDMIPATILAELAQYGTAKAGVFSDRAVKLTRA